jgi:DivIVA domain-containing protein
MTDHDLDLPLTPSAEQIRRKEFATVRRGYDTEQVRGYLELVADQLEGLERELNDLRSQVDERRSGASSGPARPGEAGPLPALQPSGPAPPAETADRISERIAQVLKAAEEQAEAAIADASAEAEAVLEAARREADRIRVDAQAHAEEDRQRGRETLAQARQEAAQVIVDLRRRRDELWERLREMRAMLLAAAGELRVGGDEADRREDAAEGAPARPDDPTDVELDSRIEQIFGPRNRVDVPDLEPEPEEGS